MAVVAFLATTLPAQTAETADAASSPGPRVQAFHVVSFEGNDAVVLDVQPLSQADTKVRFILVYRVCGTYRVQETDRVFEGVSLQEMMGQVDLCVAEKTFANLLGLLKRRKDSGWEPRQGIVSQCGAETRIYHLPPSESLRLAVLEARAPQIAGLWKLSQDIRQRYRKETNQEPFFRVGNQEPDWREQRLQRLHLAEQAAAELRNGDFDLAVPELPENWQITGMARLSEIVPDIGEATALPPEDSGIVENLDHLGIEKSETIQYPQMAKIAHIQGDVSLEVSIDSATGSVNSVAATSGHPLLRLAATDAIKKWVFLHPYSGSSPLTVKVHFAVVHCSPTIETTSSSAAKTHRKPKKKRKR